jgi:hypothetical protein
LNVKVLDWELRRIEGTRNVFLYNIETMPNMFGLISQDKYF